MKIQYTYIDYRGYPELTEIAERRAKRAMYLGIVLFFAFLISILSLMAGTTRGTVGGIICLVACIVVTVWLWTGYRWRTDRLIARAYARYVQNEEKKKHRGWRHTWDDGSEDEEE